MKLEMELVPESTWGISLANLLPRPVWDTFRREVYKKGSYQCQVCGAVGVRVNCHEVWEFNDARHIQYLKDFQCLCDDCHSIKHFGRAVTMVHEGKSSWEDLERITEHFLRVNNCTMEVFAQHKLEAGTLHFKRSKHKYKVDFGKFSPDNVVKTWRKLRKGGAR